MSRHTLRAPLLGALFAFALVGPGCSSDDSSTNLPPREDLRAKYSLAAFEYDDIPYPPHNGPQDAGYAERVALGRLLFFDNLLSGDRDLSCGSCHHPAFAWADGRDLAVGTSGEGLGPERVITDPDILVTPRNTPTNLNTALTSELPGGPPGWRSIMFWDGRVTSLENQSLAPTASFDEMRHYAYSSSTASHAVISKIRAVEAYEPLYRDAFPVQASEMDAAPGDTTKHVVRIGTTQMALAAYQRELVNLNSPYDKYLRGDDYALSDAQFRGLDLFYGKALCGDCHPGPALSDFEISRTGVKHHGPGRYPTLRGGNGDDPGLAEHRPVSEYSQHVYKFKTPGLRNIEFTGPYLRNGVAETLEDTVWFYVLAGRIPANPTPAQQRAIDLYDTRFLPDHPELLDERMVPVDLTDDEVADIVAFMCSLSDTSFQSPYIDPTVPAEVPSGLPPVEALPPFSMTPRLAAGDR